MKDSISAGRYHSIARLGGQPLLLTPVSAATVQRRETSPQPPQIPWLGDSGSAALTNVIWAVRFGTGMWHGGLDPGRKRKGYLIPAAEHGWSDGLNKKPAGRSLNLGYERNVSGSSPMQCHAPPVFGARAGVEEKTPNVRPVGGELEPAADEFRYSDARRCGRGVFCGPEWEELGSTAFQT